MPLDFHLPGDKSAFLDAVRRQGKIDRHCGGDNPSWRGGMLSGVSCIYRMKGFFPALTALSFSAILYMFEASDLYSLIQKHYSPGFSDADEKEHRDNIRMWFRAVTGGAGFLSSVLACVVGLRWDDANDIRAHRNTVAHLMSRPFGNAFESSHGLHALEGWYRDYINHLLIVSNYKLTARPYHYWCAVMDIIIDIFLQDDPGVAQFSGDELEAQGASGLREQIRSLALDLSAYFKFEMVGTQFVQGAEYTLTPLRPATRALVLSRLFTDEGITIHPDRDLIRTSILKVLFSIEWASPERGCNVGFSERVTNQDVQTLQNLPLCSQVEVFRLFTSAPAPGDEALIPRSPPDRVPPGTLFSHPNFNNERFQRAKARMDQGGGSARACLLIGGSR